MDSLTSITQLVKQLHKVQDGLKKFAHVNKKAFEQYNNFTKQRDQLLKRREDLDKSAASIQDLVQVLDQRKDEAIERTFKQVSKYFSEVFERLVPAGRGRLVMQKNVDKVCSWACLHEILSLRPSCQEFEDDNDNDDDHEPHSAIDNYTGVSIKARLSLARAVLMVLIPSRTGIFQFEA